MQAVPAFDLFAPHAAPALVLVGARVSGLALLAPIFTARTIPVMVRTAIVILLTVLLQPVALAEATMPALTVGAVMAELVVGLSLGLGAALLVGAAEAAGDLMAVQIGLSGSAVLDPLTNTSVPVLGTFGQLFAVTVLLSVDGHLVMIDALSASFRVLPVSEPMAVDRGLAAMVASGATLFSLGVRFAAPVIAAVLVATTAVAILGRAAPQLNVIAVAFPLQILVGLTALIAAVPLIATFFSGFSGAYESLVSHALNALRGR